MPARLRPANSPPLPTVPPPLRAVAHGQPASCNTRACGQVAHRFASWIRANTERKALAPCSNAKQNTGAAWKTKFGGESFTVWPEGHVAPCLTVRATVRFAGRSRGGSPDARQSGRRHCERLLVFTPILRTKSPPEGLADNQTTQRFFFNVSARSVFSQLKLPSLPGSRPK